MSGDRQAKPARRRQKKPWLPIVAGVVALSASYYHFVKLTRTPQEPMVTVASIGQGKMDPDVKRRLRAEFGDRIAFDGDSGSEPEPARAATAPAPVKPQAAPPIAVAAPAPDPAPPMQVARIDPAPQNVPTPVAPPPPEVTVTAPPPGAAAVEDKPAGAAKPRAAAPRPAGGGAKKAKPTAAEPVTVAALLSRAGAEISNGAVSKAIDLARQILKLEPDHQPALQMLMALLVEQGQTSEVRALISERIERGRASADQVMILARLVLEAGDTSGAIAVLERSAALGATSAPYRGFAGALLHRAGQLDEAVRELAAATRLAPGGAAYWLALGSVHESRGAPAEAAPAYRRAKTAAGLSPAQVVLVDRRLAELDTQADAAVASNAGGAR